MRRILLLLLIVTIKSVLFAQTEEYRAENTKHNSLIHTKLKVDFNFEDSTMNGEAWITAKPHFYPQNKFELDAKAMKIYSVKMKNKPLTYTYNADKLIINLPKTYLKDEQFTVYIKYLAQPEKVKQSGSIAISSAKGLFFINPKGDDPDKPTQIWTQGETESNSCWFPTIDSPNQKTSQEIYITVPDKFVTLSNGKLEKQTKKPNGNRTDYWVFKQKHAPYLFFMGIGEYEIIRDKYKDIPVDYYVEKKYAPYAKQIFGNTPEMIGFFSEITGIEYPWNKYAQIVGRDYVSGAMENTTAVIHGEQAYQVPGQLIDQNVQENTIAHEVFHHWFGNLVTTESWSNLTVNESFANYSEYLWLEYKYGKNQADAHLLDDSEAYKQGKNYNKNLVRFYYNDKEDMFDMVSYNKGGRILHMLRKYIGDEAFFASMNKYLTQNEYGTGEAHQWRLALEEVTGKDLNQFFNQWYFSSGHPKLEISYDYNTVQKKVTVTVKQTQGQEFKFPLAIDVFEEKQVKRHNVFVNNRTQSFTFDYKRQPNLILVNADGVLLCEIEDSKSLKENIHKLKYAKHYQHKRDALKEIAEQQSDKTAYKAVAEAMEDEFYLIRKIAVEKIDLSNKNSKKREIKKLMDIANNDSRTLVQASAIETLGKLTDPALKPIFKKGLKSKSYSVIGKSLVGLYYVDKPTAVTKSKQFPIEVKDIIPNQLTRIYLEENDLSELQFIAKNVVSGMFLTQDPETQRMYADAYRKIGKSNDSKAIENFSKDAVNKGKRYQQYNFDKVMFNLLKQMEHFQKETNTKNKEKNITILKKAMEELLK